MTDPAARPADPSGPEPGGTVETGRADAPSTVAEPVAAPAVASVATPVEPPADRVVSPPGDADPPTRDGARRRNARIGSALSLAVLVLFSVVSVAQTVRNHPQLSQIDEPSHIDVVLAAPAVVRTGQQFSPETLDIVSCRVVENLAYPWPACGSAQAVPPADYPIGAGGFTTSDVHPPVYYWLTASAVAVGGWVTDLDQVVVMRLTGAAWLALGACLTWLLARRLGAGLPASFGAAGLLAASFSAQQMSAIVNPAAMMLPVGAAYALLALWARNRAASWWALPVGAVVAMTVTAANLAGLAVVWLFLLVDAVWSVWRPRQVSMTPDLVRTGAAFGPEESFPTDARLDLAPLRRTAGLVAVSALTACGAAVAWWWIQRARAVIPFEDLPAAAAQMPRILDWTQVLAPVLNFVTPQEFTPEGARLGVSGPPIVQAIALCVLAALATRAWMTGDRVFPAAVASLAALVTLPVAYVLLWYWAEGRYFTPWFRFGLAMMPFVAASVGACLRRRLSGGLLAGAAAVGMLAAVTTS